MLSLILVLLAFVGVPLQPCVTEDSPLCYWDASVQGNGEGHSFIAFSDEIVLYFD